MALAQVYLVDQFTVGRDKLLVTVKLPDRGYGIPWRKALELAAQMRVRIAAAEPTPTAHDVRFDLPERTYFFPLALAPEFADALIAKARECDEQEHAASVVADNALLFRAGVPIGLSSDPKIQAETIKEAEHNRDLRRALPGGIKSTVLLGTPSIVKEPPCN